MHEPNANSGLTTGTVTRLAGGTATTLSGKLLGRGVQLVTQVVLARSLGPVQFGVFTLAWTLFRLASVLGTAGFDKAMTRFASGSADSGFDGQTARTTWRILSSGTVVAAAVAAAVTLVAPPLATLFDSPRLVGPLRILALGIPLAALATVVAAALRSRGRAAAATWVRDLLQPVGAFVLLPVALLAAEPVRGAAVVFSASFALAGLWGGVGLLRSLRRERGQASAASVEGAAEEVTNRKLFGFALQALSSTSFVLLLFWLDKLMVGYFLDEEAVGLYQSAVQINTAFVIIVGGVSAMLSPMVARLWNVGRHGEVEGLFRIGVRWCLYLATPILVIILVFPEQILLTVFGREYAVASTALVILALGQFVNAATGPVGQLLMMTGGERAWFILSGASVVLSLVLNAMLIPAFGIAGAATGTGVTLLLLFGSAVLVARWRHGIRPYDRALATIALSAATAAIIPTGLRLWSGLAPGLGVAVGGLVTVVVFGAMLLWFGFDPTELEIGRRLRARLAGTRGQEAQP